MVSSDNIKVSCYSSSKWQGIAYRIEDKKARISAEITKRGGRLISLQINGTEVVHSNPAIFPQMQTALKKERENVTWSESLPGGETTWPAPQREGVPLLDLNLGEYKSIVIENGVRLISPICRETGLRIVRKITLKDGVLQIRAYIINKGDKEQNASPWSILPLLKPALVKVGPLRHPPRAFKDFNNGQIPEGVVSQSKDKSYYELVMHMTGKDFKAGFLFDPRFEKGTISACFQDKKVRLTTSFFLSDALYPHKGAGEIYYGGGPYFETEVLGPSSILQPGQESEVLEINIQLEEIAEPCF